jgi:hypothetical protein
MLGPLIAQGVKPAWEMIFYTICVWVGVGSFSYAFIGDSLFFRIGAGVGIGYFGAYGLFQLYQSQMSSVWIPILSEGNIILIVPVIIGLLTFARFTNVRWLARYPMSWIIGTALGTAFSGLIRSQTLNNISVTIQAIVKGDPDPISGILMFIATTTVVLYFTFTEKWSTPIHTGPMKILTRIARLFMYACFGQLIGKYTMTISQITLGSVIVTTYRLWYDELMIFLSGI